MKMMASEASPDRVESRIKSGGFFASIIESKAEQTRSPEQNKKCYKFKRVFII